jgi:ABC-2 type transport system permease protein
MNGLRTYLKKELLEVVRTWRLWVLPGFLLFSALSAPLTVYFMPALIERFGGQSGIELTAPDPTAALAYVEFLGNLGELVMLALVIAYGGIVSSELRSGTGVLALTKPLSRPAFVLAKWAAQTGVLTGGVALATAVCVALTAALFGAGPVAGLIAGVALWWVSALFLLSGMVFFSVLVQSPAAAAGAGVGLYAALAVLGQFGGLAEVTPAGLSSAGRALVEGDAAVWAVPVLTALLGSAAFLLAAIWLFGRREL